MEYFILFLLIFIVFNILTDSPEKTKKQSKSFNKKRNKTINIFEEIIKYQKNSEGKIIKGNYKKDKTLKTNQSLSNNYIIQNDSTSIDCFVKNLVRYFKDDINKITISDIYSIASEESSSNPINIKFHTFSLLNKPKDDYFWVKKYKVKVFLNNYRKFPKDIFLEPSVYKNYYKEVIEVRRRKMTKFLHRILPNYKYVTWASSGNGFYIRAYLPISINELVTHCGKNYLTEYVHLSKKEFIDFFRPEITNDPEIGFKIFSNLDFRKDYFREIENKFRVKNSIPEIGKGNISQHLLFKLIQKFYPEAKYEFSPEWLGKQRFDIYLPSEKTAIEYNGEQHYEPIEAWGGEEALKLTKKRDKEKEIKCINNNTKLLIWTYKKKITEQNVEKFINEKIIKK